MVERPSDKFLSREKAYELEHKTGFSRKELLTFHKHYGACIDSLGRITEEDKQAFLKEMDLENDEVTLQVMDSIQAIERKKPGKASKQKKGRQRSVLLAAWCSTQGVSQQHAMHASLQIWI